MSAFPLLAETLFSKDNFPVVPVAIVIAVIFLFGVLMLVARR